jgi:hypothetical protein
MAKNKDIKTFLESFTPTEAQSQKMFHEILTQAQNDQQERTIDMKRKMLKSFAISAAVLLMAVTSVFAAANFDVLKEFFAGDVSLIRQNIKMPRESISDGRFKLTVEEILTDNRYVFMVYSVEGLNDDAIGELMGSDDLILDNDFKYKISVSPSAGISAGSFTAYYAHSRELKERRTATTRYWVYYDEMENVSNQPLTLRLTAMSGEQYIVVPTDCNVETKELTLTGQPYGDVSVQLSPIGITLEKGVKGDSNIETAFNEVFFRMKDGQIKTYHQLASAFNGFMAADAIGAPRAEYQRYKYNARFLDVIPLSDFKSIIVGNIEYDVNNPAKTGAVTIDAKLYPVEVEALLLKNQAAWLSVKDVCDKLGADMTWDGSNLIVNYRGGAVEITNGNGTYLKDGKTMAYQMPQSDILCVHEDKLFINWSSLCEALRVGAIESDHSSIEVDRKPTENQDGFGGMVSIPRTPQYTTWYVIP